MQIVVRRAEPRDAPGAKLLIKDDATAAILKKRFGNVNSIAALIDIAPLSLVATDAQDTVIIGFCAFSNGPPPFVDYVVNDKVAELDAETGDKKAQAKFGTIARDQWDSWLRERYDIKDVSIQNSKFLAYFIAYPDHQIPFLDAALSAVFSLLPSVRNICYLLPDILTPFAPLNSQKFIPQPPTPPPEEHSATAASTLGVEPHELGAGLKKLKTKVKSMTNIFGLFKKPNGGRGAGGGGGGMGLLGDDRPIYFSEMQAKTGQAFAPFALQVCCKKDVFPVVKIRKGRIEDCDDLVPMFKKQNSPEVGGVVAGFMSLTNDVDQDLLAATFDLDAFDNLIKDVPPEILATANGDYRKKPLLKPRNRCNANATCFVSICCALKTHMQTKESSLFKAAFALFPDRDYCVITVPSGMPEIPMLRSFTMVQPRYGKMTSHCLYILNRFGCTETVYTRVARATDYLIAEQMVQGLAAEYEILTRFNDSFTDSESEYKSFIAEANGQTIGIGILEKLTFASTMSDQFDIEEFVNLKITPLDKEHVLLRHMILNPLFAHQAKWFIEEIMRMAGISCILYPIDEDSKLDVSTRMLLGKELVPVKRRKQITYVEGLRDGVSVSEDLPYNLQLMTSSLLYEPKLTINTKIVVVGGSDTGIAFLEKLVYTPHLYFSNITLISTAGVPSKHSGESFVDNKCYSQIELKQLGLDHYIRIIRSSTTEFDRVLKRVRLDNEAFITYDFLFLTPGVQFFASNINEDFESLSGVYNLTPRCHESYMKACMKLMGREEGQTGRIVVYGRDLQVFVTVQELIKKGINPSWIVLVIPPQNKPSSCFDNSVVEAKIIGQVQGAGVKLLFDYRVSQWESSPSSSLTSVTLEIPELECFLYADVKSVDPDTFTSINDSCLVFDARLVIDKYFRTQDTYIYAAGSLTKYSSKYQTKWTHTYFDSREVGFKLAETVMPFFDPITIPKDLNDDTTLLKFIESKKIFAVLPGSLNYFHFDEPRLPGHTLEFMQRQPNYGRDLVIDTPEYGYFRIRVDPHGFIRSLTYLGTRPIPVENYLSLYGLNERYLNRLVARFDEGVIPDFVSFLSETWAYPIFHDRFPSFIKECRTDMLKHDGFGIKELVKQIEEIGSNGKPIEPVEREDLVKQFQASSERKIWDAQLFEFYLESKVCASYP
ncbi:hypothetical protein BDR26DRAFT_969821 [Obelidium mucronatum]|nr:hypothetical protein BDR26DRAFT_969821 [Obelidium mucronatum]